MKSKNPAKSPEVAAKATATQDVSSRRRSTSAVVPVKSTGARKSRVALEPIPPAVHKDKQKVIRDSFTFPKDEYDTLDALKRRAMHLARPIKKGELIRAGIATLKGLKDSAFVAAIDAVPRVKAGRPKRDKAQGEGSTSEQKVLQP
ncbi:hypothetical protein GALL_503160 [mine drainage metagenome]|uniref:Uncharacterized protein n=1 Tax=mine drainage metagenome TaxID=410659 RepID=A0A1J5PBJ5_9ZZZZ